MGTECQRTCNLQFLLDILNSKLIVLLIAAVLASQLCPRWLESSASTTAQVKWQLETREKTLNAVDNAALSYLLPILEINTTTPSIAELVQNRKVALIESNKAMVLIRLLYGTDIMEKFRKEVNDPLSKMFINVIAAKRDNKLTADFLNDVKKKLMDMSLTIDRWEKDLADTKMNPKT